MWQDSLPPHVTHEDFDRFVIAPHHPDRLRRPAPAPGTAADDRYRQALLWNTFRTLELIAPWFWLRRLHLQLTGDPALVPPQIARVTLWQPLPLPPIQRIDGARPEVLADVVIETEHTVWTLIADPGRHDLTDAAHVAAIVDAGAWLAGSRQHVCGVIESPAGHDGWGSLLKARYARSRESARLRSPGRGSSASPNVQWGSIGSSDLAALVSDCAEAAALLPVERALARNAAEWLGRRFHPEAIVS